MLSYEGVAVVTGNGKAATCYLPYGSLDSSPGFRINTAPLATHSVHINGIVDGSVKSVKFPCFQSMDHALLPYENPGFREKIDYSDWQAGAVDVGAHDFEDEVPVKQPSQRNLVPSKWAEYDGMVRPHLSHFSRASF